MAKIIIIAAIAKNNIIGKNGKIPWHIKEDLQHFKKITLDAPIVVGHVTYDSLPIKPLPKRINIVLNQSKDYAPTDTVVKHSFEEAMEYIKKFPKVYIIGGRSIYKQWLDIADELELTKIDKSYEGDTYFPEIDFSKWTLIKDEQHESIDEDGSPVKYSFCTYIRKIRRSPSTPSKIY